MACVPTGSITSIDELTYHMALLGPNGPNLAYNSVPSMAIDEADDCLTARRRTGAIKPACHVLPPQCESQPCMNGGVCTEGWNRFLCDCSTTSFNGPTCGKGTVSQIDILCC